MVYSSSMTQKGQVTIPREIRRYLRLKPADKVVFVKNKENIIVIPADGLRKLKGSISKKAKFSDSASDKLVLKAISSEYEKASHS